MTLKKKEEIEYFTDKDTCFSKVLMLCQLEMLYNTFDLALVQ